MVKLADRLTGLLLPREPGLLPAAHAPDTGGIALMPAAKKRKKKKKPAPSKPAPGKQAPKAASGKPAQKKPARRKRPTGAGRSRHDRMASRTDAYLLRWKAYFASERYTARDWGRLAILAVALMVVLYYAFSAGGYFVAKRGYGELVILYALVMGLIFKAQVEGRLPRFGLLQIVFFGAYTLWMLLSTVWSLSPSNSLNEFVRGVLYLAGFGTFLLFLARREWLRWLGTMFVIIVAIVAIDGLLLKVIPDVMVNYVEGVEDLPGLFIKMDPFESNRLSYPITYWNTMGLFMIMAFPISLRSIVDRATPLVFRCLHAAAQVLFVAVIFYTVSRASILLLAFTVALYILVADSRLRAAMQAGLAALWAAVLIAATYMFMPAMIETQPAIEERVSQGHSLGLTILLLILLAAAAQVAVWRLEKDIKVSEALARRIGYALAGLAVVFVLGGFSAITASSGGPIAWVKAQFSGITERTEAVERAEERLLSLQSERFEEYKVSVQTFSEKPLTGTGAATWEVGWLKNRPYEIKVKDGHSWLFETMAELGLVGTLLLVGFVGSFFANAVRDLRFIGRNRDREVYGAVFVACTAMLLHSVIDWDWEMPVVTLSFFMFAGALVRYGMLVRKQRAGDGEGVGDGDEDTGSASVDAGGFRMPGFLRWNWFVGVGCVLMMVLTVIPIIEETRITNANQSLAAAKYYIDRNDQAEGKARLAEVESNADAARRLNPLDAEPLVQLAIVKQALGEYEEAERLLMDSLRLEPDNYETYQKLAEVYIETKEVNKAVDAIHIARGLNPFESKRTGSIEERVRVIGGKV